jgi:hypothetical protein
MMEQEHRDMPKEEEKLVDVKGLAKLLGFPSTLVEISWEDKDKMFEDACLWLAYLLPYCAEHIYLHQNHYIPEHKASDGIKDTQRKDTKETEKLIGGEQRYQEILRDLGLESQNRSHQLFQSWKAFYVLNGGEEVTDNLTVSSDSYNNKKKNRFFRLPSVMFLIQKTLFLHKKLKTSHGKIQSGREVRILLIPWLLTLQQNLESSRIVTENGLQWERNEPRRKLQGDLMLPMELKSSLQGIPFTTLGNFLLESEKSRKILYSNL